MSERPTIVYLSEAKLLRKQTTEALHLSMLTKHGKDYGARYEHFKGTHYWVLGVGIDTTTDGNIVIYINLQGELFSRPWAEFVGYVDEAKTIKRFTLIPD